MKRVILICPALPEDMPYLRSYLDYLESFNIVYDITYLSWNNEKNTYPSNYSRFDQLMGFIPNSFIQKTYKYYKYSHFVIDKISKGEYTHVITMGIACSVFMSNFLKRNFKCRYIYDIRDYSQILRVPFFGFKHKVLLQNSFMNVISSGGFKQWLPNDIDYTVCHNTTLEKVRDVVEHASLIGQVNVIKVLTIGQIRDLNSNRYVIKSLSNNDAYEVVFAGKGMTLEHLKNFVKENGYTNVRFTGEYRKDEEDAIVEQATLINVCMGDNIVSNHLLSNRLYLAARLKKPLISFDGCYQAEIIKKYDLGVVINREDNFSEKLQDYIKSFSVEKFTKGCEDFLRMVRDDLQKYSDKMDSFIGIN